MEIKFELSLSDSNKVRAFATFLNTVAEGNAQDIVESTDSIREIKPYPGSERIPVETGSTNEVIPVAPEPEETPVEKPKTRKRAVKAEPKEAPEGVEKAELTKAEVTPREAETKKEESTDEPTELTLMDIREALSKKVTNHRGVIKEKMKTLGGAANVTSIEEKYYNEFHEFLTGLDD